MRGEKILELGFEFEYSAGGKFERAESITLRAPGFKLRHIHATMTGFVSDALIGLAGKVSQLRDAGGKDDSNADAAGDTGERDALVLMSMGLGPKFADFHAYVIKTLTNTQLLAAVGGTTTGITDAVWESIEEQGGMAAVDKIVGEFSGFFLDQAGSKLTTGNGKDSPATSSSLSPVH
jgi:hypothetical protein